jgi:DNA-binding transcriptional LysR family regulator
MDLKQITYFIAIAEKGSISAAAAHVRIAQPALSAQIANLEADLGITLFSRHGRGVTLTPAGAVFLDHAPHRRASRRGAPGCRGRGP